jgi:hypothetical protein
VIDAAATVMSFANIDDPPSFTFAGRDRQAAYLIMMSNIPRVVSALRRSYIGPA